MSDINTFSELRPHLFGIAYRMLGSVQDAEDIVQEAYLRWDRSDTQDVESPKAWLSTVVTRLSIDELRSARKKREEYVGEWLPEPLVTDRDRPDTSAAIADSLSTAFLILLESLSPAERAAFLLREVFDYDYGEVAEIVEKTEANCRQMVKRARDRVAARAPRFEADPQEQERLLLHFMDATTRGDVDSLVAVLAEDATFHNDHGGKAQAARRIIYGASKVARFMVGVTQRFSPEGAFHELHDVNGRPGFIVYTPDGPETVLSFEIVDGRVKSVYATRNPDKLKAIPRATS